MLKWSARKIIIYNWFRHSKTLVLTTQHVNYWRTTSILQPALSKTLGFFSLQLNNQKLTCFETTGTLTISFRFQNSENLLVIVIVISVWSLDFFNFDLWVESRYIRNMLLIFNTGHILLYEIMVQHMFYKYPGHILLYEIMIQHMFGTKYDLGIYKIECLMLFRIVKRVKITIEFQHITQPLEHPWGTLWAFTSC